MSQVDVRSEVAAALERAGVSKDRLWDVAAWHEDGANGYERWISHDSVAEAALWAQLGVPEFVAREARNSGVKPTLGMNLESTVSRIAQSGLELPVPGTPTLAGPLARAMREELEASPVGVLLRGYNNAARFVRLPDGWLVGREDGREVRLPRPWAMTALSWFCMLPMRPWYVFDLLDEGEAALLTCPFLPQNPKDFMDEFVELHASDEAHLGEATWWFDPEWGWPVPQDEDRASTCVDRIPVGGGEVPTSVGVPASAGGELFHQLHRLGTVYLDIRVEAQFKYESIVGFRARSDEAAVALFRGPDGSRRALGENRAGTSPPPPGWTSHAIDRWLGKGGSREVAERLGQLGWRIREADKALQRVGADGLRIPPLPADHYRSLGDTLVELAAGDWPLPPHGCLLSIRVERRSGERERLCLAETSVGQYQVEWFRRDGLGWSADVSELHVSDEAEAVSAVLGDTPLRRSLIIQIDADERRVTNADILSHLVVDPTDGAESSEGWSISVEAWLSEDEALEELSAGVTWLHRWGSIRGQRVTAVRYERCDVPGYVPVLVDPDEPGLIPVRTMASYDWFSESGGAPISWDGHFRLHDLGNGLALEEVWGDTEARLDVSPYPSTPESLARSVANWIVASGAEVTAAVELAHPDHSLESLVAEIESIRERLRELGGRLDVDAAVDRGALVDALIHGSDIFKHTWDALMEPESEDGQRLRAALLAADESGVTGPLLWGDWSSN